MRPGCCGSLNAHNIQLRSSHTHHIIIQGGLLLCPYKSFDDLFIQFTALTLTIHLFLLVFKMARNRECILCETVYSTKQEMDEHMRSMLHHRELEKLKGRDCGHGCRVCKLTVVSLTDYASHISSAAHKQNVEAAEKMHPGNDETYFDQALVDLIGKRKEQIRKEKNAAAAKLAKEEEDRRRKEEFQQRLKETKERYRLERAWKQQSQGFSGSGHRTWYGGNQYNGYAGAAPSWQHGTQRKSATWHAREPPNFQRWAPTEFAGASSPCQEDFRKKQCDQGSVFGNQRSRLPWLSNGGSSNGVYGRNNISQSPQRSRHLNFLGPFTATAAPPNFLAQADQFLPKTGNQQGDESLNGRGQTEEPDHSNTKSSKTFGSNPKLDKACRWSPYPVPKGFESALQKDTNPNSSEQYAKVPKPQTQDKALETSAVNRQSRPEQKLEQFSSSGQAEEKGKKKTNPKTKSRDSSSSNSSGSSAQKDGNQNGTSGPSSQKAKQPAPRKDKKAPSLPSLDSVAQTSKASSVASAQSNPPAEPSGSRAPLAGPLQSRPERQLPETLKKAKKTVSENRARNHRTEVTLHIAEDQQSPTGANKSNRQNAAKPSLPDLVRPEKPALQSSDSSQFLQSLQVSTSTMESSEPASSSRDGGEEAEEERRRRRAEMETDEASPAGGGPSSESDASRSGEAQTDSREAAEEPRLDLPPVLKRDLTKHIGCKSKAGSHEPNLNIARRVRNLSESRRSDTEKDSGLKPTVRQLLSASGSRRNVNWDQVYQEVRKKQDKGKGMPRFGIEMVPMDQEDQSQDGCHIPLLEGFEWESLVATPTSRKRSLSESSITPASSHSLFTSLMAQEEQREALSSEKQRSVPPDTALAPGNKDTRREVERTLDQSGAEAQKQPDKLMSATARALRGSDSVLGDSSSGTELCEGQGTGKRRRAETPSAEASCLNHSNKRRKVKSKKERLQIDQLLTVSLREDELSRCLQTVDGSLIQARAALEAAYMEVQRLMVVKQQVKTNTNKSIAILHLLVNRFVRIHSFMSVINPAPNFHPSLETKQTYTDQIWENFKDPADCKESLSDLVKATEKVTSKTPFNLPPASRRSSEASSVVDCAATQAFAPHSALNPPASPSELRGGKRVRKLKKRKVLKKALGAEQPESSDTEVDGDASRPRWLRPRRRPSGSSVVSTSSPPSEGREGDAAPGLPEEACRQLFMSVKLKRVDRFDSRPRGAAAQLAPYLDSEESMQVTAAYKSTVKIKSITCSSSSCLCVCVCVCVRACASDASSDHGVDDMLTEGVFEGHQEAVNAMQVHNGLLYTCSGDRTIKAFDLVSHKCVGVFEGHSSKVSCLLVSAAVSLHHRLYSGSSDQTIRCYNLKTQELEQQFTLSDRVLCLHSRWKILYAGLANGMVVTFNLKTNKEAEVFDCHGPRAVSCLASSQEGARKILLVGSYDSTISVRDAKSGLLLRTLQGHTKTVLCMKVANDLVFSGSSDQCVYAHNIHTGELVRVYKGHSHAVTVVSILGKVMVTACLDKLVRVFDLQSHSQLQVYGGHKDMVMCMAVHKNMIYSGCYDGSVQAVKLNLMQNYRCRWLGCSLVFGMMEHLQHHVVGQHAGANSQLLKCRWKNCEEFFCPRNRSKQVFKNQKSTFLEEGVLVRGLNSEGVSSMQEMLVHMQKHAEEETQLEP
uniref:Zinc finger protein 106 n=1 Tax=Gasterosteus aculeatus aculeatus TaxID=481459 RepID=A0AAQ4QM99_GASAC